MGHILTAELGTETDLVGLLEQLFLQLDVTERTSGLVAGSRQRVVVVGRSELNGKQVLLGGGTTDNDRNVVRRTSGCTERFHFLYEEGDERTGVLDTCFGLLVEVGLVGRTATLGDAQETVLSSVSSLQVNLCGEVALGVNLVVHIERCVLGVAQVALGVGVVDATREGFLIAEACPDLLAFLAVDDSGAGVLAEGQLALASHLGIAEEGKGYVFIVSRSFRVAQDLSHLLVVAATEHEADVMEGLLCHEGQGFGLDFQDLVSFELAGGDIVFGQQIVLGLVLTELKHRSVLEFHNIVYFLVFIVCT